MEKFWKPKKIVETEEYKTSIKKLKLREEPEDKLKKSIYIWLRSEHNLFTENKSNKLIFSNSKTFTFIFSLKLAHPDKNKGKSGGLRLVVIYDKKNYITNLGKIFNRKDLNHKGQSGKRQKEYESYTKDLKNNYLT